VRRPDRVVAARHQHHVAVLDADGLVQAAVVGIDALEGEALGRVDAVIIGLLQRRLLGRNIAVVLMRRIARPVAGRRHRLDHQQALGRFGLRKDVAHEALIGPRSARLPAHAIGRDQPGRTGARAWRGADGDLRIARGGDGDGQASWDVDRARSGVLEHRGATADAGEPLTASRDIGLARQDDNAGFAVGERKSHRLTRGQLADFQADIAPAGALRRDVDDPTVRVRRRWSHTQVGHGRCSAGADAGISPAAVAADLRVSRPSRL
jgi:hypothetical protein